MKTLVRFGSSQNLLPASEQRESVRDARSRCFQFAEAVLKETKHFNERERFSELVLEGRSGYLLPEQQFPTGGIVRERDVRMNRCDSGTDSIVWMEEDKSDIIFCPWDFDRRGHFFRRRRKGESL